MPSSALGKRKDLPKSFTTKPYPPAKRVKTKIEEARSILTESTDRALNKNGDLNVASFVKAREFEIKAMGASMVSSKNALSTRAFQQLPKQMRRRTASHNVKRVPKRLRKRAAREMKDDNTPTVTSRRRVQTPHQRLRLEKAKKLKQLGTLTKKIRAKAKDRKQMLNPGEPDPEKTVDAVPRPSRLKKDTLSKPSRPPARYRKRQIHKSWLPTHVWHAKRAKMTDPTDPLWKFAVPLSPTEKCFRTTHRSSNLRGCLAWDMSYVSTIGAEGTNASLLSLLRALGVDEVSLSGKRGGNWRKGARSWEGWIRERDGEKRWIAPLVVVWCVSEEHSNGSDTPFDELKKKRKLFIRVHPSAFLQVWNEVLKVAKIQRPQVMIEDLRFEIGSIDVAGPCAMEALIGVLHTISEAKTVPHETVVTAGPETGQPESYKTDAGISVRKDEDDWVNIPSSSEVFTQLSCITNPSSLPPNALLAFDITDPRLRHPPQTIEPSKMEENDVLSLLASWPPDQIAVPHSIFDRAQRLAASRLPSQKAINRRKADAGPGAFPRPLPKDPQIPVMLLASRTHRTRSTKQGGDSGSYTLLLPWACVQPFWYSLMHYPLSSGGTPRFGGLQEKRQTTFESQTPWFPGDFPGTRAGWAWEMLERGRGKAEWDRKPKGKRCEWESVDLDGRKGEIGVGWGCDWERLFSRPATGEQDESTQSIGKDATVGENNSAKSKLTTGPSTSNSVPQEASMTEADLQVRPPPTVPLSIHQIPSCSVRSEPPSDIPATALTPIHLTLTTGHPRRNARIYRLPATSPDLRSRWLALASTFTPKHRSNTTHLRSDGRRQQPPLPKNAPQHAHAQRLAASLLFPPQHSPTDAAGNSVILNPNSPKYPPVPDESDLIGFVTSTNYQLGEGRCEAIGNVAVSRVLEASDPDRCKGYYTAPKRGSRADETSIPRRNGAAKWCIIRDAGQSIGRLARWSFI